MPHSRLLALSLAAALAAPVAAQTTHDVGIVGFSFSPQHLEINVGDTVTWTNNGGFHNVDGATDEYPDNPEGFRSGEVSNTLWTFSHTFTIQGEYGYHCEAHGAPGVGMFGTITVASPSSNEGGLQAGFALSAPSPNPFRGETAFTLTLARPEPVRVAVYDALGREVAVLHDGPLPGGTATPLVWAPRTARSGAYLVRIEGATFDVTRKVVLVR
jgi:plastocyanin